MSNLDKLNHFISNLNVVLILIGYPFVVSIFIPFLGDMEGITRTLTIPFRLATLLICFTALFLNIGNKIKKSVPISLFFLFWLLVLFRMFYDLEIRSDFNIPFKFTYQIWSYAIFLCFIPMISILFSYNEINLNSCLKYIYIGCVVVLFFSMKTTLKSGDERIVGNVALDSISFAQISLITSFLSLYRFVISWRKFSIVNLFYLLIASVGFYVGLKSGSRGPLLGFFIVLLLWYVFKKGFGFSMMLKLALLIILFITCNSWIIRSISYLSPVTAVRFSQASEGTDLSVLERQESYYWFINNIMEHPFWGSQFARLSNTDFPGYAHNIFLDILLGFGIFGLFFFLYLIYNAFRIIKNMVNNNSHYWVGLFMIQVFVVSLFSGAYYSDPLLNCSILLVFLGKFNYPKLKDCKEYNS